MASARTQMHTQTRVTRWGDKRILDIFCEEISRRGGETVIYGDWQEFHLEVEDRSTINGEGYVLLRAEGWRQYSRAMGAWKARLAYLCGVDDNGPWAARVPGTVLTVEDALKSLVPAEVASREHLRQGDVYLVRMARRGADSPSGVYSETHLWDADTRTMTHTPEDGQAHQPVTAPEDWPSVKVVPQKSYATRRGYTRD